MFFSFWPRRSEFSNNRKDLIADLIAGLTVAIVALPLAIGFGITSGMSAAPGYLNHRNRLYWVVGTIVSVSLLTPLLSRIGAAATWSDAFLLVGSLVAQILMVYEKVESWVLWLIIDAAGTIQYAYLGYWFTAVLYALFSLVAIIGWKRWYVLNSN